MPNLCKAAPATSDYHIEDVHRAGGMVAVLGELERAGLIHTEVLTVHSATIADFLDDRDTGRRPADRVRRFFRVAPSGVRTLCAMRQARRHGALDLDREAGCIRDVGHAYAPDGGLTVLHGGIAADGCIVKTAAVDPAMLCFEGPAVVFESQDEAADAIPSGAIQPGCVIVVRYEGPKGSPGMQEMLYPTVYLRAVRLDKSCAMLTDGPFSGASAGLSIGHVSPEAAEGGTIALVEDSDTIRIDITKRSIELLVDEQTLEHRRAAHTDNGKRRWRLRTRQRRVSTALQLYANTVSNASKGAVQQIRD